MALKLLRSLSERRRNSSSQQVLPICSYCRKVRDSEGDWDYLENYLSRTTSMGFSHGVCDHCLDEHFPEVVDALKNS